MAKIFLFYQILQTTAQGTKLLQAKIEDLLAEIQASVDGLGGEYEYYHFASILSRFSWPKIAAENRLDYHYFIVFSLVSIA